MKILIAYDVLPSDWSNLVSTFIDSGLSRYWCDFATVQARTKYRQAKPVPRIVSGRWRHAAYGADETYTSDWRLVVKVDKALVGARCFDGKKWGWREGEIVKRRYDLTEEHFSRVADRAPGLFAEWLESGERNISTKFDACSTDSIIQLACFGVEVFA